MSDLVTDTAPAFDYVFAKSVLFLFDTPE